jgi:hypothetical protein
VEQAWQPWSARRVEEGRRFWLNGCLNPRYRGARRNPVQISHKQKFLVLFAKKNDCLDALQSTSRRGACHAILSAMAYIVIEVDEPPADAYWTLLDASGGRDLRAEHKYGSKAQAEEVADLLNGVEPDS